MNVGAPELGLLLVLLLLAIVTLAVPIWAVIDIAVKPDRAWHAAGRSKTRWLVAIILCSLLGLGIVGAVVAIVYLTGPRVELNHVMRQ